MDNRPDDSRVGSYQEGRTDNTDGSDHHTTTNTQNSAEYQCEQGSNNGDVEAAD